MVSVGDLRPGELMCHMNQQPVPATPSKNGREECIMDRDTGGSDPPLGESSSDLIVTKLRGARAVVNRVTGISTATTLTIQSRGGMKVSGMNGSRETGGRSVSGYLTRSHGRDLMESWKRTTRIRSSKLELPS